MVVQLKVTEFKIPPALHCNMETEIHLSIHPFIHSSIHPIIQPTIHSSIKSTNHPFIHPSRHPSIDLSNQTIETETFAINYILLPMNFHPSIQPSNPTNNQPTNQAIQPTMQWETETLVINYFFTLPSI